MRGENDIILSFVRDHHVIKCKRRKEDAAAVPKKYFFAIFPNEWIVIYFWSSKVSGEDVIAKVDLIN